MVDALCVRLLHPSGDWQDVVLTTEDFSWSQAQMGDLKKVSPSRELSDVLRVGLMKYDGTAQPFDLEIASIEFREEVSQGTSKHKKSPNRSRLGD